MEIPDPFLSLAGRCSGPAWDKLKELREHPLFEAILEALRQVEGTILEVDVDQAYLRLVRNQPTSGSGRDSGSNCGMH